MRKRGETLAVEFALLFKFRNVSINLRESILFQLAKRATEFEIPQHDRTIHLERACRPLEKLIKFSFAPPPPPPPPLFSRRNFCRWEGDKNRKKKMEGKKEKEERRGEEGWACIVASTDRSKSADSDMEVVLGEEARNDRWPADIGSDIWSTVSARLLL